MGWTEERIRELAAYHDNQTVEEQAAEIEAAVDAWNKATRPVRVKKKGKHRMVGSKIVERRWIEDLVPGATSMLLPPAS